MRVATAEFFATALLLAVVVGSGVMGSRLAGGNEAVALLANSLATAAGLAVLVLAFGPISGAHMNPAMTCAGLVMDRSPWRGALARIAAQLLGAAAGVLVAHAMFDLPLLSTATQARSGAGVVLGEFVATFLLVFVVLSVARTRPDALPAAVALTVFAGYWFTSSTCFANPAVTLARTLTGTFTGIRIADVPGFLLGQAGGAGAAVAVVRLFRRGGA